MKLLRQVEAAIAAQDADPPPRGAVAGAPHLLQLAQAGPVLMLEHHQARMLVDQLQECRDRDVDAGAERIILEADRDVRSEPLEHGREVILDRNVGLESRRGRDHDAACTGVHGGLAQVHQVIRAGVADADDDRDAPRYSVDEMFGERRRFGVAELLCLAHHPEDRDAAHALAEIELDERIDARPIDRARVGERRHGDDEDATTIGADLVWHEISLG